MTEREIIDVCRDFFDEMYNGGFQFVLENDHPYVNQLPQYMMAIGAADMAEACRDALSVFPGSLPVDAEERSDYLCEFEEEYPGLWEHLDTCNARFNELDYQLEDSLSRYIDLYFPAEWLSYTHLKAENLEEYYCKVAESTFGPCGGVELRWDNLATVEIEKLDKELYARPDKGSFIARNLLCSTDPRIRYHAAAYCLKAQIHVESAKLVLTQIGADRTLNGTLRYMARTHPSHCEPYTSR